MGRFAAGGGAGLGKRRERGGKGREREVEGRERRAPKLLLNQGPSEPCYATAKRSRRRTPNTSRIGPSDNLQIRTDVASAIGINRPIQQQ